MEDKIIISEELKARMIREAMSVLHNSYAPYSHYNVAAAALMGSGRIYTGVNIESSLLSCTICAERNAIFHAAAQGERRLLAIAIVGGLKAAELISGSAAAGGVSAENSEAAAGGVSAENSEAAAGGVSAENSAGAVPLLTDYCTPCGVCRQVMRDFTTDPSSMLIICAKSETDYREWSLEQMLPESFGPEDLE